MRILGVGCIVGYCNYVGGSDVVFFFIRGDYDGMYDFCILIKKYLFLFDIC